VSVVLSINNKTHYLLVQRSEIELIVIKIWEMFSIIVPLFCARFFLHVYFIVNYVHKRRRNLLTSASNHNCLMSWQ